MRQSTLTKLALLVFALVLVSFLVRGFGQFVVGPRRATILAGPVAMLAALVLVGVVGLWLLGRVGVVDIERDDAAGRADDAAGRADGAALDPVDPAFESEETDR